MNKNLLLSQHIFLSLVKHCTAIHTAIDFYTFEPPAKQIFNEKDIHIYFPFCVVECKRTKYYSRRS